MVKVKCNCKIIPMKASRNLFSHIALILQTRAVALKDVFCYPLGPIPWSLGGVIGGLNKTPKVTILHELEKGIEPVDRPSEYASIVDGMAILQKAKVNGLTYGEMAKKILGTVIGISSGV